LLESHESVSLARARQNVQGQNPARGHRGCMMASFSKCRAQKKSWQAYPTGFYERVITYLPPLKTMSWGGDFWRSAEGAAVAEEKTGALLRSGDAKKRGGEEVKRWTKNVAR